LSGYRGPYRGQVIDSDTKQPLKGAVVLAVWEREIPLVIQTNTVFYDAREVLTDGNGEFVVNAEDVEANAPSRTLRPIIVIFLPEYGSFPNYQTAPKGFIGGVFEGKGAVVELPSLKTRSERLDVIRGLPPILVPEEKMPNLLRLMNIERSRLGLAPIHKPGVK
jgi:hypothetical protein